MVVTLLLVPVLPLEAAGETITLNAPNGGEEITAGDTFEIRWTASGTYGAITLDYSVDSGENWVNIGKFSHSAGNSYHWFVPPTLNSTHCRVRIIWGMGSVRAAYLAADESDADFTIQPGLVLRFSEQPDTVGYGAFYPLKWNLFDPDDIIKVLRLDQRVKDDLSWGPWVTLTGRYADIPPTVGGLMWSPPYYEEAQIQLRLRAIDNTNTNHAAGVVLSDVMDLRSGTITLIKPDGGEPLFGGTTYTIEWQTSNDPSMAIVGIGINYSLNSGRTWINLKATAPDTGRYDWLIPTGIDSMHVRVRVWAQWGEWHILDTDESTADNAIISDPDTVTVSLIQPNPPVDQGDWVQAGTTYEVRWRTTGDTTRIDHFTLYLSLDSGRTFEWIGPSSKHNRRHLWRAPDVDTVTARIKIVVNLTDASTWTSVSNHDFIIFAAGTFNRPPYAEAGDDQTVAEGTTVRLDGTRSLDEDGDVLTYTWTVREDGGIPIVLEGADTATPSFVPNIRDYEIAYLIRLEVSDGIEHDVTYTMTDDVTVTVTPGPPVLEGFEPMYGFPGTKVTIRGRNLMGAEVLINGDVAATVLNAPTPTEPDPDTSFNFTLHDGMEPGRGPVAVRNRLGTHTSADEFEVFPIPQYCYDHALGFHNPSQDVLSYPWNPWGDGRYKDTFGDQVYINIWICIGIPWWDPWNGWVCLGYEIETPIAPDPLAALFYAAGYHYIARNGECFGMSSVSLQFANGIIDPTDFAPTGQVSRLEHTGDLDHRIDYMHGSQLSSEVLGWFLDAHINSLIPSSDISGMGLMIEAIKASIRSEDYGVISIMDGAKGHVMVPYLVQEVDSTHTRIYVYDPNREWWADKDWAVANFTAYGEPWNIPPYIEVVKEGMYWDWSYRMSDTKTWGGDVGIAFVPNRIIQGDRTLPTAWDGLITILFGDASSGIEDAEGNVLEAPESGPAVSGIPDAILIPDFQAGTDDMSAYAMPAGTYTYHIDGVEDGSYNWTLFNNWSSGLAIEGDVQADSEDTVVVSYDDDNPLRGRMTYSTSDGEKGYDATQVKRFGTEGEGRVRTRVYKVLDAELHDDSEAVINTTDDYDSLVFFNNGPHEVTFDVEFQTNVLASDVWNATGASLTELPTARRTGITIGPYETMVIRPTDWLDLNGADVIIEGEVSPTFPGAPRDVTATHSEGNITVTWTAPDEDGGSPVTGYIVLRGASADDLSLLATLGPVTSYLDTDVEEGRTYHYAVRAINAVGEGDASDPRSVEVPKEDVGDDEDEGFPWILIIVLAVIFLMALGGSYALARGRGGPPAKGDGMGTAELGPPEEGGKEDPSPEGEPGPPTKPPPEE